MGCTKHTMQSHWQTFTVLSKKSGCQWAFKWKGIRVHLRIRNWREKVPERAKWETVANSGSKNWGVRVGFG